jgi:hypothetical protein
VSTTGGYYQLLAGDPKPSRYASDGSGCGQIGDAGRATLSSATLGNTNATLLAGALSVIACSRQLSLNLICGSAN